MKHRFKVLEEFMEVFKPKWNQLYMNIHVSTKKEMTFSSSSLSMRFA